jgi:hypothetical protein
MGRGTRFSGIFFKCGIYALTTILSSISPLAYTTNEWNILLFHVIPQVIPFPLRSPVQTDYEISILGTSRIPNYNY